MMSPYLDHTVHAVGDERYRRHTDHRKSDEIVRSTVRFRVGQSLVSIGTHLMGSERPRVQTPVRPAA